MKQDDEQEIDRLSIRERPEGLPLMQHHWGKLLFMHWPLPADALRALIPERLTIDTYDGEAWIGVTPFTLWDVRLSFTPPVPYLSDFHELNVRTYVHLDGVPGVWFFSLDTNSTTTVWGARTFYHLPYFNAGIDLEQQGQTIKYHLQRTDRPAADFDAAWTTGERLPEAAEGSLEFFLTERYCLYSARDESLYRARIHHRPWPLRRAGLSHLRSTMIESHGLPTPDGEPLLHYAEALEVGIWPPAEV
ncbi:MAG TPA: DUF2071 domain-containing protein [Pyrinomonadaceae bacterium]|jgi:uncharacterized protein YqjF (DUF2071 family)|nr:DUF2071 domain-containing protein [Pyrinomonadaceae bacterium]